MKAWLVRDIMTTPVETMSVGDTLAQAREQLRRGRIRHLPVVDGEDRLVGLLTHRQILGAWLSHGQPNREAPDVIGQEIPVEMLMANDILTVDPETTAAKAAELLTSYKFGCLPVVDERHHLIGILTEADFVRFAQKFFEWDASS